MLTLTRESAGEGTGMLKLAGEATIEHAGELRQALLDGLTECARLLVDCSAVKAVDFFAVQVLCSAHRTSFAWNKEMVFHGPVSAAVAEGGRTTGFARQGGCSLCPQGIRCLWLEEDDDKLHSCQICSP